VVRRGQTAWRIARAYGVPLETLADANGLTDPTRIEVGDVLFIPGASERLEVAAYPAPLPGPARERAPGSTSTVDRTTRLGWPLDDTRVLSSYGVPRGKRRHKGIDLRGRYGQTVFAADSGTVLYAAATMKGYGKAVILDHGDGWTTLYAHNSALLVRVGETVERGAPIARVGRTGNASGLHCHFEVRRDDVPVDPLRYLSGDIASGAP
jgi:murein DD-endopeptidase MepM/ murein hydrolase activator NlpD